MKCIMATLKPAVIFFQKSQHPRKPDGKDISNFEKGRMEL